MSHILIRFCVIHHPLNVLGSKPHASYLEAAFACFYMETFCFKITYGYHSIAISYSTGPLLATARVVLTGDIQRLGPCSVVCY